MAACDYVSQCETNGLYNHTFMMNYSGKHFGDHANLPSFLSNTY